LIFLCDIFSLKQTIVQIIGHFLTSVKFREIPQQYQNSTENGKLTQLGSKFRGPQKTVGLIDYKFTIADIMLNTMKHKNLHIKRGTSIASM